MSKVNDGQILSEMERWTAADEVSLDNEYNRANFPGVTIHSESRDLIDHMREWFAEKERCTCRWQRFASNCPIHGKTNSEAL